MHSYVKKFQAYFVKLKGMYPSFGNKGKNRHSLMVMLLYLKGPFPITENVQPLDRKSLVLHKTH